MAMGLMVVRRWSDTLATSGAKAAPTPEWVVPVTTQPQPPGTQVGTLEANAPRPLSKPSFTGVVTLHGVGVNVGVLVDVGVTVGVAVGGAQVLSRMDTLSEA